MSIQENKTCSFTGHRPNKLKGYNPEDNKELLWRIYKEVEDHIDNKGVTTFISGMALGVDMWAAKMILRVKRYNPEIKLICAIPCANHSLKWNKKLQKEYNRILHVADKVVHVSTEEYKAYLMQKRNEWMVDNSDYIIAVWDGTSGGTGNCVKYAEKVKKQITQIKP